MCVDPMGLVRQHDPSGANANRLRLRRDMADDDACRRTRDPGHVVMLGEPEPPVTPAFGVLCEFHGVPQRIGGRRSLHHVREIENRQRDHRLLLPHLLTETSSPNRCYDVP